ncbi:EamA family transporter [Chloroflexota bacterium]
MTTLALILVLLSATAHVTWNFLAKRATNQGLFIWWLLVAISVLLSPLAVFLAWRFPIVYPGWWFILGTVVLHSLYFIFLGCGYTYADLSLVYPIARGSGPALVPILGVLVLKETVTLQAAFGIAAVVTGIYTTYWWGHFRQILQEPFKIFKETGARYALLTGLTIAIFSVWDKVGIQYVNPLLYMYLLALGSALLLTPLILRANGISTIINEGRSNARNITISGLLLFSAYGLILLALQFSQVSYIAPCREVGIAMGVALGIFVLKEPSGKGRIIGSCLIVLGLILIALAD